MSHKPRTIEIEQQLAQLRWRRLQNERSIRNYLETTKVMKQKDTILGLSIDQSAEKIDWLDGVVRDELARPLVLSDHELHQVELDEHRVKHRLVRVSFHSAIFLSHLTCLLVVFSKPIGLAEQAHRSDAVAGDAHGGRPADTTRAAREVP